MVICCPICEQDIEIEERGPHHTDHKIEITNNRVAIYDMFVCPKCQDTMVRKTISDNIANWDQAWECL